MVLAVTTSGEGPLPVSRRRVLVVDDNVDGADMLAMLLEMLGYHAIVAYDGAEALDVVATAAPDLVFCDLTMPVMDGYEVARRLRGSGYAGKLIALTGHTSEDDRVRTLEAGFDVHAAKPLAPEAIDRLLADA